MSVDDRIAKRVEQMFTRLEHVLARVESLLPAPAADLDWTRITAARWRKERGRGYLKPIAHPHAIALDSLVAIDAQKQAIDSNTRQFVAGLTANNVLLTGSRGTGKSSLVKAMLAKYQKKGLRLIEVDKADLIDLPDIVERIETRPERFVVFCDDLTFDAGEAGYKALKVVLDGSITGGASNVLVYATSNRRHLMPEYMHENLETKHVGDEVHPGESVEEKISLSERFGLWISFYPFAQDDYLAAVHRWLEHFGVNATSTQKERDERHREAIQYALQRGSRSGRVAWQFAKGYAGARALAKAAKKKS
ncbi:MAG TPA: ATP-binding protein [Casimicrobiaceae bacterium]|nr:ATP-binding protein [Casimicrobiaceae bacterium]